MQRLCLVVTPGKERIPLFRRELTSRGFKAYFVHDAHSAGAVLAQWHFDAIVLEGFGSDPATQGVLDELARQSAAPVLLIVDAADEDEQVRALELGAADTLVAPYSGRLLCAKLGRLIDLSQPRQGAKPRLLQMGALRLDPGRALATYEGQRVPLTGGEFELLVLLATHQDEFVHRDVMARALSRGAASEAGRSADMHVCRIRRKLREAGAEQLVIETVYGRGYMLRMEAKDPLHASTVAAEWSV